MNLSGTQHSGVIAVALSGILWAAVTNRSPAQESVRYNAEISLADRVNSQGQPLRTLREFLRQDRFNVHSDRHVDPGDSSDPLFRSAQARGLIDRARLVFPPGLDADVVAGRVALLEVTVTGSGNNLEIEVDRVAAAPPATAMAETPATQQEAIYFQAEISPADRANSRGVPLRTLREFLRQDRFNVHSNRHVDPGDSFDPLFHSAEARGLIDRARFVVPEGLEGDLIADRVTRLDVAVVAAGNILEIHVSKAGGMPSELAMPGIGVAPSAPMREAAPEGTAPGEGPVEQGGVLVSYATTLGERDYFDSNGERLVRFRDFLLRDRVNVNMLGNADPGDEKDFFFLNARQRRIFDSGGLMVDPELLRALLSRETLRVRVTVTEEKAIVVTRPDFEEGNRLRNLEDIVHERGGIARAMIAAGDDGAVVAARELIELGDLTFGRHHGDSIALRVNLASFLIEKNRKDEMRSMLPGIEADFRLGAQQGLDGAVVSLVLGFLPRAHVVAGDLGEAERLLEEILDPPGAQRWRIDEEQRRKLGEIRGELSSLGESATSPDGGALAEWNRIKDDPDADVYLRLGLLNNLVFHHRNRRGEEFDDFFSQLRNLAGDADREVGGSDLLVLADSFLTLAYEEFRRGDLESARLRGEEVVSLLAHHDMQEQLPGISARLLLVRVMMAQGDSVGAEHLARKHFEWAKAVFEPYDSRLGDIGTQWLEFLADRGDASEIDKSFASLAESALAATEAPTPGSRVIWHEIVAEMLFAAGEAGRADAWYRRIIEATELDASLLPVIGDSYSNWGHLYERAGRYGRAEEIWIEGVERVESSPSRVSDHIILLQDLSLVRKHYRDDKGAVEIIEKARTLAADHLGKDSMEYAVSCNNLVLPLRAMGRLEEAMRMSDESLRVAANHPEQEGVAQEEMVYRNNRAILLMDTDVGEAIQIYQKNIDEMERRGLEGTGDFAIFLNNLGQALQAAGRVGDAEEAFSRAREIVRNSGEADIRNLSFILDALAGISLRKGDLARAVELVREAIGLSDQYLETASDIASESDKLGLGSIFDYGKFIYVLLEAGEVEEACELSLRTKGMILDQSIRDARAIRQIAESDGMQRKYRELRSNRRQLNRIALALEQGREPDPGMPALTALRREVNRLQKELLDESAAELAPAGTVDLAAVRARLRPGERFLEFVQVTDGEGNYVLGAFEISPDSLRWVNLASLENARKSVAEFREAVDAFMASQDDAQWVERGVRLTEVTRELSRSFWEPFLSADEGPKGRVVLCPDSVLHFVPFAVLINGEGRFPAEELIFDYVVSARDFCRERAPGERGLSSAVVVGGPDYEIALPGGSNNPADRTAPFLPDGLGEKSRAMVGIGRAGSVRLDPLPGAEVEAGLIAQALESAGAAVSLLTAAEATERTLAAATGPSIVHVATHGIFFDLAFDSLVAGETRVQIDPMLRGALALAGAQQALEAWEQHQFPDPDDDGWLFAAEAAQLDLRGTELVTLSACETGLGSVASGEGVIGLRRAFLAAGARHVLSTLWPIADDVTVELMREFYLRLGHGEPVVDAFASAHGKSLAEYRENDAVPEAIALFGAFVLNRSGD
jgi:CHAT domain-containing protein/tetratricopeptide (TPR) repeat protein